MYEVGFKDVYPWVWSVMLGVALTLATGRGAFLATGTSSTRGFWIKDISGILLNVMVPAILFGLTMTRVGPRYSANMDFWQILGSLYLAGAPLGCHHLWILVARKCGWTPIDILSPSERATLEKVAPRSSFIWVALALIIPALAAILARPLPY